MSQTKHDIVVQFSQIGLDQVNGSMKTFSTTSGLATKSQDALGGALGKTQGSAVKLRGDIDKTEKSTTKANTTTGKFATSQDKAGKSTQSFAEKFRGNRGLIFSVTGIITAGIEAIGMFQNFQNALAKQAAAQDQINKLEAQGITTGREYTQAQRDLDDANRSVTFALRIMALSMGDLIPYTLLIVNQFVNMRTAAAEAAAAKNALTTSVNSLGSAASTAASGGLTQVFNAAGQLTQGVTSMDTTVRNATVATNEMYTSSGQLLTGLNNMGVSVRDNTTWIGTRNSGLVGGVGALNNTMTQSTSLSTKFSEAFRKIGDWIRALPQHFSDAGAKIKNFFANFGTNMAKIPGLFKAAGTAVLNFGRALITAFLSNPILGIITAIGVAISALIFDFGGFRTAINKVGEAIGNAIPFLKGALTWIGEVGNAALDSIAGFFGFETGANKAAKAADALKNLSLDPLIISLQKYLDLGNQFQNLNAIVEQTSALKDAILGLTQSTKAWEDQSVHGYSQVYEAATDYFNQFTNLSDNAKAQKYALLKAINLLETGNYDLKDAVNILMTAYNAFDKAQGEAVETTKKEEEAKQELEKQIKLTSEVTDIHGATIRRLIADQREAERSGKDLSGQMSGAGKIVQDYTNAVGLNVDENQALTQSLLENAHVVALVGDENVVLNGTVLDVNASIAKWRQSTVDLEKDVTKSFGLIVNAVMTNNLTMDEAIELIEKMTLIDEKHGKALMEKFKNWQGNMIETKDGIFVLNEAEEKQGETVKSVSEKIAEAHQKRKESIAQTAQELQIYDKIQKLSLDTQEFAIKLEQNSQSEMLKTKQVLMELAHERGLDIELLDQGTEKNLEFIKTHQLAAPTIDEVRAKTGQLIAARQESQKATALDQAATEDYVKSLGIQIDTTGLSAKTMLALVDAYDETQNATQIATDDIAEWSAQLTRNQAVEEATIEQLLEYARVHGIEIPQEVERSSAAIKDFIENGLDEIGPAAEEAAKEALAAFDEIAGKAHSALEGIISDQLGEDGDEIKKAIKGIKKIGVELDSVTAAKHIIQVFLDDENFENDLQSLGETMLAEFGRLENFSREEGIIIGDNFVTNLAGEIDGKMPEVATAILQIWNEIKNDPLPGETGDQMLGRFLTAVQDDATLSAAGIGITDSLVGGIDSGQQLAFDAGGNLVMQVLDGTGSGIDQAPSKMEQFVSKYLGPAQDSTEAQAAGSNLAGAVGEGAMQGADTYAPGPMDAFVNKYLAPAQTSTAPQETGLQMGQQTSSGVQTGIAPMPGIFNQAFVDASVLAGATLAIIIQAVQTTMSNMSTSVATYSNSMKVNFTTALNEMTMALPPLNEAVVLAQQTMSTLSTSVSTYANSMMTNITSFTTQAITDLGLWDTAMGTSQQTASTLSTSVATYTNSMKTNITSFRSSAESDLGLVETATVDLREELSSLSTSTSTYMRSMESSISSFAKSAVSDFKNVERAVDSLTSAFNKMKSAADKAASAARAAAKAASGVRGFQHGGSFLVPGGETAQHFQHGGSFIALRPTKIGNNRVGEVAPELVTVTPLDPSEPTSPFSGFNTLKAGTTSGLRTPDLNNISSTSGNTGGMGGGTPTTVTGSLHATITLPNGETLAKVVKPYMLKGYSGIVS